MIKKIVILALCLCLLTACSDSSSTANTSSASNSSEVSSTAPADDKLWNDSTQVTFSGAKITIPNGYVSDDNSVTDSKSYKGPNDSRIFIMTTAFKMEMNEASAKKELEDCKDRDGDSLSDTKWTYTNKEANMLTICDSPAIRLSYHVKAEGSSNSQEWDESVLYFNSNENTIRISLQGDLLNEGNFKKFCDLIELPGVKNAKDISFDDVNYVEVDDLMIPVPKGFEVKSENSFNGENASIYYFSTSELYDLSEYGMNKEVDKLKEGYNEPDAGMFQDNEVHSSKLDFIGGKMAYYISYTAKIKDSADDKDPTVVEHIDIYINSSKQGVNIMLSGDMTKESNFKAFCEKVKYK